MDPDSKKVFCFRSHVPGCFPSTLRAHNDPTDPFHNETLVTATNEINAALRKAEAEAPDGQHIDFLIVPSSNHEGFELFLAWSQEAVGAFNGFSQIEASLGLASAPPRRGASPRQRGRSSD